MVTVEKVVELAAVVVGTGPSSCEPGIGRGREDPGEPGEPGRSYLRPGTRQYCRRDHWLHPRLLQRSWRGTVAFGKWILEELGGRCSRNQRIPHLVFLVSTVSAVGGSSEGNLMSISLAQRKAKHRY